MVRLRSAAYLLVLLSLLIAAGCGGGSNNSGTSSSGGSGGGSGGSGGGSGSGPTISNFSLTPTISSPGQWVNFTWATSNATAFNVTPNIAGDDQQLPLQASPYTDTSAPQSTTTFQATATNGSATSPTSSATLTVVPVTLNASSTQIEAGQSVQLTFSGPNNGSVSWQLTATNSNNPITVSAGSCSGNTCSGSYQTQPLSSTTTFQLGVQGPIGQGTAYSQQVTVNVGNPTTVTLMAHPQSVQAGQQVTLTWTSQNASSVTITPGVGQVGLNGSTYVYPTQTTTYTATATSIYPNSPPVTATATVTVSTGGISNLNHIIYMLQENRAFDNYFGVLAEYRVNHQPPIQGAQLSDVNDLHNLPAGYKLTNPEGQQFAPFHARTECVENLSPAWDETHYDIDLVGNDWLNLTQNSQYLMDRFLDTTRSVPAQYDPTQTRPLGYYDQTDLPFYYELATQFATSDTWYSPVPANTIPNRMYLFAATSYGHAFPPTSPSDPAWLRPTFFRKLTQAGITWRYYYQDNSVFLAQWADWNNSEIRNNVRNIQEYYNILASRTADHELPQVIFIERASSTGYDEHPDNNIQTGAARARQVITAMLGSGAWPDSAFILTYDEGGGLFDHVKPILVTPPGDYSQPTDLTSRDQRGMFNVTGFRVPVIVVSPWVKPHDVSHLPMDYTAILKLIETRFTLPALTQRDANAGNMTDVNNGFFDFTSPHMLVVPSLPTQPTNGDCDPHLESHP